MYYAGIDIGSTTTKTVIIDERCNIIGKSLIRTGVNMKRTSEESLLLALEDAGISSESIQKVIATGYGRNIAVYKDTTVPEIIAIGQGVSCCKNNGIKTILDIGGQDTKVVRIGEDGSVVKFMMNDMCAAGTGRFLENIARALDMKLEEMVEKGYNAIDIVEIGSACTVFAESEIITCLSRGERPECIFAGLHKTMMKRAVTLIQNVGFIRPLFFTGGVTKNKCIRKMLEEKYGEVIIPENPQLISAMGAAMIAIEKGG